MRDLSFHLLDILGNSYAALSTEIGIKIIANSQKDLLVIEVVDNGKGMNEELLKSVVDPFVTTRTSRRVGLGIPLYKASCIRANGEFSIESKVNLGTCVTASFVISHIDRLPLGDIAETIINVIVSYPDVNITLVLCNEKDKFDFSLSEIRGKLGDVPVNQFEVITWIKEYLNDGIKTIFGGVLNEIDC